MCIREETPTRVYLSGVYRETPTRVYLSGVYKGGHLPGYTSRVCVYTVVTYPGIPLGCVYTVVYYPGMPLGCIKVYYPGMPLGCVLRVTTRVCLSGVPGVYHPGMPLSLPSPYSRFTVGQFFSLLPVSLLGLFSRSLCKGAFCSGIMSLSCSLSVPVSLLVDSSCSSFPVSLLGSRCLLPAYSRLIPHCWTEVRN